MDHRISANREINEPIVPNNLLDESPATQAWDSISDADIIIAVMGRTGAGKSSLINTIVGAEKTPVGNSLRSCTQDMKPVEHIDSLGRRTILVDSPGFDNTHLSDLDTLARIANWLKQSYQRGKMLSGVLYLHQISDNRMGTSSLKVLQTFKDICGEDAFQNVILVTTMWDEVTPEEGNERERKLQRTYWNDMLTLGARMERFVNTKESAEHIISKFGPETRRPLLIQKEMVDERKPLSETTAGRHFFRWLVRFINFIQKAVKALRRKLLWAEKAERSVLKENIRQQQCLLEAANARLESYNTLQIPGASCPQLNLACSTRSEPVSFTSTTPSSPSDMFNSQNIDLHALRTKSMNALKTIHRLLSAFPVSRLSGLVEMVIKIGEMIEITETPDDVVLSSQFQDICNVMSSIIEAAQSGVNGPFEGAIIDTFMTDMIKIKIIGRTSGKCLVDQLHSCNQRFQTEGNIFRLSGLVQCGTRTTAIERLNLLIKQLQAQGPRCPP